MLVLTIDTDQSIYIGDDVKITLLKPKPSGIILGAEGPKHTKIYRAEVRSRMMAETDGERMKRVAE